MKKYFDLWKNEILKHKLLLFISFLLLLLSTVINYFAGNYADRNASFAVTDLILDFLPTVNLLFIFVWGYLLIITLMIIYPLFFKISKLHVIISQFSLLVIVRSIFILFTHLRVSPDAVPIIFPGLFSAFTFRNDLFFSGHVSVPFLGYLIFRNTVGKILLASSIFMGVVVLFMHAHYSIDVFAAFFITYGTYVFGKKALNKINHLAK